MGRQSVFEGENYHLIINHSEHRKLSLPDRLFLWCGLIEGGYLFSGSASDGSPRSRIHRYNLYLNLLGYMTSTQIISAAGFEGHLDDGDSHVSGRLERRLIDCNLADTLDGWVRISPSRAEISVPLNPAEEDIAAALRKIDSPYENNNCSPLREKFIEKATDFVRIGLIVVNLDMGNKDTAEMLLKYFANHAKNYK